VEELTELNRAEEAASSLRCHGDGFFPGSFFMGQSSISGIPEAGAPADNPWRNTAFPVSAYPADRWQEKNQEKRSERLR
jgi:hypothetical protein